MHSDYQLSPHEMLRRLQNPHEIISNSSEFGQDIARNGELIKYLDEHEVFGTEVCQAARLLKLKAVDELRVIVTDWIQQIYASSDLFNDEQFFGDLQVFGSVRTKLDTKDGDVDTIVIAPHWVDRDYHFFGQLPTLLRANQDVKNLYAVQETSVPLMRFKYKGIQIDMVFASVKRVFSPLSSSTTTDDISQRSMDGLKAADYFANVYQDQWKLTYYLRAIKLWAVNRGIYGGINGYLGGISWQILAIKIHQLYPYQSLSQLLDRFFFIYSQWKWSEVPVYIEKEGAFDSWKGLFLHDRPSINSSMTIYTPIFPHQNSSHNVTQNSLRIIQQQFLLATAIMNKIKNNDGHWSELFTKIPFFEMFPQYIEIKATSQHQNELFGWKGHIESKLRKLTKLFEDPKYSTYFSTHLYPVSFHTEEDSVHAESFYFGIKPNNSPLRQEKNGRFDITQIVRYFMEQIEGSSPFFTIPETLGLRVQVIISHYLKMLLRNKLPKSLKQQ